MASRVTPQNEPIDRDSKLWPRKEKEYFDMTERELWWRRTIRETPIPGTYDTKSFVDDLAAQPVKKTYGFKSEGRKRNADPSRKGAYLMPGLYENNDGLVNQLEGKRMTYNFVSVERCNISSVVTGAVDKVIQKSQVGPATYDPGFRPVLRSPVRDPVFKSQSQRFPTIYFKPREGPAPGQYETSKQSEVNKCVKASAPFKSKTPRFIKPHFQKTPGPGSYTKMNQIPMPSHVRHLGRYHGLFFPPGVY